jgi:HAE1 family hydrophobic/amphiphilic exporter-1
MRLSDISIKNPVFAWMLMAALLVFGGLSFSRLGVSQLPDVDFPMLTVSVSLEGAAPEVMESTVVDILENALMSVEGVRSISSSCKTGVASISLEFELEKNVDVALQEVQSKLAQAQRQLPKDVENPIVSKTNPDDQPILWLALTYEKNDLLFLMKYARDYLKDRFTTVPGVGDIFLGGYVDPQLRVWVKPQTLPIHNIAVNDIIDAIGTEHLETPGGSIETGDKKYNVRTLGEAKSVEEFKNIVISRRAGQLNADPTNMVKLSQVVDVEEGLDEIRRLSRFDGKPALGLGIRKQRGSNAVAVAKAVKAKMAAIQNQLPDGMQLNVNFDTTTFIESSVHELNKHLLMAVILTSLVCWVFLGSWSATFNVLLSIPTSIVGTFIALYFLKFTLNTFTLLGLTLAIGIVVDDAIMVLENIFRYNEKGQGRIESAIIGSREIAFAAMAASVAVMAIFLPVAFMKGVIGKFFMQFGVTISFAVFLSLIESLTITPMRCAAFVQSSGHRSTRLGRLFELIIDKVTQVYTITLKWTLKNRWKVLFASVVFLVASFALVKKISKEFSPAQDQSRFIVRATMPVGSSFAFTNGQTKRIEEWFRSQNEVKSVYASVGGFGGGMADTNVAMLFISMKDKKERGIREANKKTLSQQEFMNVARGSLKQFKDIKIVLQDLSTGGFGGGRGFPIEFIVMGPEWEELHNQTKRLMEAMEKSGFMQDVDSNYLVGMPEISIIPDRLQAALRGVSISNIGKTISALIAGVKVGEYAKDGHRYDIRLMLKKENDTVTELKKLTIGNSRSNLIPLSQLVHQEERKSIQTISRVNRQRAISVYANLKTGFSQPEAMSFISGEAKKIFAPGYMISNEGSSKTFADAFKNLILALALGFVVAYMVLAAQFNSFLDPLSILIALPFSVSGAFMALFVTNQSINIYSMIGILLLMGIVKKNSILLVEFTNHCRDEGITNANHALETACPIRLRPILMTSFATIAGAIPSAVATGAGSEVYRPMALTIIGGVLVSTVLTLYVVPCFYSLVDRLKKRDANREQVRKAFHLVGHLGIEE